MNSSLSFPSPGIGPRRAARPLTAATLSLLVLLQTGCQAPIAAEKATPARAYAQTHDNPFAKDGMSAETKAILHRFGQDEIFEADPDTTLTLLRQKATQNRERSMLFALAELNYLTGDQVRKSVKPWEPRDARDYYLASAVYAWMFLFGDAAQPPPGRFDGRLRSACDLYNYALGWALTGRRATNAVAVLAGGVRPLPGGRMDIDFDTNAFPWPMSDFDRFVLADHFVVRGLSVRNRQRGLGAPLIGVTLPDPTNNFYRAVPATVLLRVEGGLTNVGQGNLHGSLELYSPYDEGVIDVNGAPVPLETDTSVATAYLLNQSFVWDLGMSQFFSPVQKIPTGVYLTQPYRPGRVPVVFVHGTFSSPVWWAEMANTLASDPVIREHCQLWYFIYNSGNPVVYSADMLRTSLEAKIRQFDPDGRDPALHHMVVIGHSQGGLLTKLTATDTDDKLLQVLLKTNNPAALGLPADQMEALRHYLCYQPLPFVSRVVFIATPHRGSYQASTFVRRLALRFVTLPATIAENTRQLTGLSERIDLPEELRGTRTSLDSMSPKNPVLLALADIPVAPGVEANSIIAVEGEGDYHKGKDGLVAYDSAHVDYAESEFIVRSFHSCLAEPAVIEEVRRILREHLADLPGGLAAHPTPADDDDE